MRELLASIDRAGNPLDVRNPLVDVVDGYRRWADVYDLPGNPLITCEEPAVRPMLDRFEEDPVLDAACGTGRHLAYLAQVGRRVVGTDISPDMLDKAREKVAAADLRLGDLTALPLEDSEVHAVVCALAVEHVMDLPLVYKEFARVTVPGAPIVVSTMHPITRSVLGWGAWFVDGEGRTDIPTYAHAFKDHVNAAAAAGLILQQCEEPTTPEETFRSRGVSLARRIAFTGMPIVLVLQFERT